MKRIASLILGVVSVALAGCSNFPPLSNDRTPVPTVSGTTTSATPEPETEPTTPASLECVKMSRALLSEAENRGNAGGAVQYTAGQMVKVTDDWWFVGVRAKSEGRDYGARTWRTAFVTNQPSGGSSWVPLSDEFVETGDWDGVLPSGDVIAEWEEYRQAALDCLR